MKSDAKNDKSKLKGYLICAVIYAVGGVLLLILTQALPEKITNLFPSGFSSKHLGWAFVIPLEITLFFCALIAGLIYWAVEMLRSNRQT